MYICVVYNLLDKSDFYFFFFVILFTFDFANSYRTFYGFPASMPCIYLYINL